MGHSDPIETVYVTHEEGNEREKNGVKRGFGGFYGAKLLKTQGEGGATSGVGSFDYHAAGFASANFAQM